MLNIYPLFLKLHAYDVLCSFIHMASHGFTINALSSESVRQYTAGVDEAMKRDIFISNVDLFFKLYRLTI